MPIKDYTSPHLGEYIRLLQRLVPVNGHLLTNREVALMAGLSESTYKRVKKGQSISCMPITPYFEFTWKPVVTVRVFPLISSLQSFTVVWKLITGPVGHNHCLRVSGTV